MPWHVLSNPQIDYELRVVTVDKDKLLVEYDDESDEEVDNL